MPLQTAAEILGPCMPCPALAALTAPTIDVCLRIVPLLAGLRHVLAEFAATVQLLAAALPRAPARAPEVSSLARTGMRVSTV